MWLFRLALLFGAPLVFFFGLEGGLRISGYGRNPSFFIKDEAAPGYYRTNPRFTELFFPASFGLKPLNFRLPRAKPAGTKRVFVLGESAAMGVPEPAFGLAPQLQAQLRGAVPGQRIEVYNLGVTAINSHAVRRILDEALAFEPDLVVIYMGNNEVVGPYGAGAVVTNGVLPLPLIRASLWIRGTRTGQLLQALAARLGRAGSGFRDWRGMEMFADKAVPADDPRLPGVYRNFSANLEAMLAAAREAGVKTVLSTVAVNVRDCAPFVSHGAALPPEKQAAFQAAWTEGRRAEAAGDLPRARARLAEAVTLDPGHAAAHYLLAAALEASGEAAGAREHYFAALQQDALRFRADATINRLIREVAGREARDVTLVDAARELGADISSPGALAGSDLFFEHVHLTWEGNFALVRALAPAASAALAGPASAPRPLLASAACAEAVGFTELGRLAMLRRMDELNARPPFTGQVRYAADRTRLARQIAASEETLAAPGALAAIYARLGSALARDPDNLALLFQAASTALPAGDPAGALPLLDRLAEMQPFSAEQAALRAVVLKALGRDTGAEEAVQRAIAHEPYYFQSYTILARLWIATGRTAQARTYFAGLVERMPDSRLLRSTYAQLLAAEGNAALVEAQWREVLRLVPDDESALAPLLQQLTAAGRTEEALTLMRRAHAYNPRSFANNQRLVEYYDGRSEPEQTVAFMQDLAESGPVNALLFRDLALNLEKVGRHAEVRDTLLRGRRIAAAEGETELLAEFDRLLQKP